MVPALSMCKPKVWQPLLIGNEEMKKDFKSVKYRIIISFWRDCAYGIVENGLKKCERQQVEESQSKPSDMRH